MKAGRPNKIADKVFELIRFCEKNTKLWALRGKRVEINKYFAHIEDGNERKALKEEFAKYVRLYRYIINRRNKLGPDSKMLLMVLKKWCGGETLGYISEIETIAKKCKEIDGFKRFLYEMDLIYGGLDNFKQVYIESLIKGKNIIPEEFKENFVTSFDLNQADYIYREDNPYKKAFMEIFADNTTMIINSENMDTAFKEALERLNEREKIVIIKRYGIECERQSIYSIADELNLSGERIRQIEGKALKKLKNGDLKNVVGIYLNEMIDTDKEEEFIRTFFEHSKIFVPKKIQPLSNKMVEKLTRIIKKGIAEKNKREKDAKFLQNLLNKKRLDFLKEIFGDFVNVEGLKFLNVKSKEKYANLNIPIEQIHGDSITIPEEIMMATYKEMAENEGVQKYIERRIKAQDQISKHEDKIIGNNPQVSKLKLSRRIVKSLNDEGIYTLVDLLSLSLNDLKKIETLEEKQINSLLYVIYELGFDIEEDNPEDKIQNSKQTIDIDAIKKMDVLQSGLSLRTANCLKRAGINNIGELLCYTEEELRNINFMGIQTLGEIKYFLATNKIKLCKHSKKKEHRENEQVAGEVIETQLDEELYSRVKELFEKYCSMNKSDENKEKTKKDFQLLIEGKDEDKKLEIRARLYKDISALSSERKKELLTGLKEINSNNGEIPTSNQEL